MVDKSAISWTDATWNCIRGCTRKDEDCENCYAENLAATRLAGPGMPYKGLAVTTKAGRAHWTGHIMLVEHLLDQPLRWRTPRRIFVASMSDPCHEAVPIAWIARMWAVMSLATWHQFQLLTKRPARMYEVLTAPDFYGLVREAAESFRRTAGASLRRRIADVPVPDPAVAPARHIWLGTSVGSNKARQRCVDLARVPAGVRMLSLEPLHGPVDRLASQGARAAPTGSATSVIVHPAGRMNWTTECNTRRSGAPSLA
jgi:protein gp37